MKPLTRLIWVVCLTFLFTVTVNTLFQHSAHAAPSSKKAKVHPPKEKVKPAVKPANAGKVSQAQASSRTGASAAGCAVIMTDASAAMSPEKAAWEISRHGVSKFLDSFHRGENAAYYILTALMAGDNILLDGNGGSGKTYGLRKILEAQLRSMNELSTDEYQKVQADLKVFIDEIVRVIREDQARPKEKKLFTLQFHEAMSDSKLLGSTNPLTMVKTGVYERDTSRSLVSSENVFALLDELDKAMPSVQVTLFPILAERQALDGNRILNTSLETVGATINASLAELIAQADPYELGGRQALLDRFPLKLHMSNISANWRDSLTYLSKVKRSKEAQQGLLILDVLRLRSLLDQVQVPEDVLRGATDVALHMDRKYTAKYNESVEQAIAANRNADYYPPYAGTNRNNFKVPKLWLSAFLVRQLIEGVPFEHIRYRLEPLDLVDLAPALLHGGPDTFIVKNGARIKFRQYEYSESTGLASAVTAEQKGILAKQRLSVGSYNLSKKLFQYRSIITGEWRQVYFDDVSGRLQILDQTILRELSGNDDRPAELEKRLARIHKLYSEGQITTPPTQYESAGYTQTLLSGTKLRRSARDQLSQINEMQNQAQVVINNQIQQLESGQRAAPTYIDRRAYQLREDQFAKNAEILAKEVTAALRSNDQAKIEEAAAKAVRAAYEELTTKFQGNDDVIRAMIKAMVAHKNMFLFGPPGSAKTLLSRLMFNAALAWIKEVDLQKVNATLAKVLVGHDLTKEQYKNGRVYVKQFNPMSSEVDIIGIVDLKKMAEGQVNVVNRDTSLSQKDIMFAILDEFTNAPPGVRNAALSILNEREVFDGFEVVKSFITTIFLTSNSTPGEFLVSQGQFYAAFPQYDRIHKKGYMFNKMSPEQLFEFFSRVIAGWKPTLQTPLFVQGLTSMAETRLNIPKEYMQMMASIDDQFKSRIIPLSESAIADYESDPQSHPDFFMNTRGESLRSLESIFNGELNYDVITDRVLSGKFEEGNQINFDLIDLKTFGELYLTANFAYGIEYSYENDEGIITFKVKSNAVSEISDRLNVREMRALEYFKLEATTLVEVLNAVVTTTLREQVQLVRYAPNLFPTAFVSVEKRKEWLRKMGVSQTEIDEIYGAE